MAGSFSSTGFTDQLTGDPVKDQAIGDAARSGSSQPRERARRPQTPAAPGKVWEFNETFGQWMQIPITDPNPGPVGDAERFQQIVNESGFSDQFRGDIDRTWGLLDKRTGIPGLNFSTGFRTGLTDAQGVISGFEGLTAGGGALESLKEGSFDAGEKLARINRLIDIGQRDVGRLGTEAGRIKVPDLLGQGKGQLDLLEDDLRARGNFGLDIMAGEEGGTAQLNSLRKLVDAVQPSFLEQGKLDLKELGTGVGGLETRVGGLGGFADFEGVGQDITDLATRVGGLGQTPTDFTGIGGEIGGLQELVKGLGGLTPDFTGIGGEIGGLADRVGALGQTPTDFLGIGSDIDALRGRVAQLGQAPVDFSGIGGRIGGLADRVGALGDTPTDFTGVGTDIDALRGRIAQLGLAPVDFSGIGQNIDALGGRVGALGSQETPGLEEILTLLTETEGRVGGLGTDQTPDFSGIGTSIDELAGRIGGLGALDPRFDSPGGIGRDIGGLESRIDRLGDVPQGFLQDILGRIGGAEGRIAGLGNQPTDFSGIGTSIDDLAGRVGALGGITPDFSGIGTQIGGLGDQVGALGEGPLPGGLQEILNQITGAGTGIDRLGEGALPQGIQDILSTIGGAQGDIAGLGGIKPNFEDLLKQIGGFQGDISGLGGLETGLGPQGPVGDLIAGLQGRVQGLGGQADFTGIGEDITGLEGRLGNLGLTDPRLGTINEQVGNLEGRVSGLGGLDPGLGDGTATDVPGGTVPPITDTDSGNFINQLQGILFGLAGADPLNVEQLRADPVTAALLAELEKESGAEERRRTEQLQRFGALSSGDSIRNFAEFSEGKTRAELDILGRGAERARADRETGLGQGIDLAGLASDRELSTGEMMGMLGGEATIGGRQSTMDSIAALFALLDPELSMDRGVDIPKLARAILNSSGFSDEDKNIFGEAFGVGEEGIPEREWKQDYFDQIRQNSFYNSFSDDQIWMLAEEAWKNK